MRANAIAFIAYLVVSCLLTYPLLASLSTDVIGSGLVFQNLWNLWWVEKAVTELHSNPFYTDYLFYPTAWTCPSTR